jgi:hypothetical protein
MFKSIDIELDGHLIPELGTTHYAYKYYLEHLLSYSPGGANQLVASGFAMDPPGDYNKRLLNAGWLKRQLIQGEKFEFYTPLTNDFLNSDRLLPPNMKLQIRLNRAPLSFYLHGDAENKYQVELSEAKLFIRYIELSDSIRKSHLKTIQSKPAIFPMNKVDIKTFSFPQRVTAALVPNAFTGHLPKHIIIGMVDQEAFHGRIGQNPFHFKHYEVSEVYISVNGEQVPSEPYKPDFESKVVMREYRDFFDNIGIKNQDLSNFVTYEQFIAGCTLLAFDLTPEMCGGHHYRDAVEGHIDIHYTFKTELTKTITMIVMGTYDSYLSIDGKNAPVVHTA